MSRDVIVGSMVDELSFDADEIARLVNYLDDLKVGIPPGELQISFLGRKDMCTVHAKFLHDETLTDVITFPGDPVMRFAGEICVSVDYAEVSALEHNVTFDEELTLYIVHGCLHLSGLNDILENEIIKMRQAEKFCMDAVKAAKILPKFSFLKL